MGYGTAYGVAIGVDVENELVAEAKKSMHHLAESMGLAEHHDHTEVGNAHDIIIQQIKDNSADLLIIGSHGRSGWRALLGSTANAVLHESPCDVLAVKTKKSDSQRTH